MNIIEILNSKRNVFVEDEIENKKVQTLVVATNNSFVKMADAIVNFANYKNSQLKGEVHNRIVMAKSLLKAFPDWEAVAVAHKAVANEEVVKINEYNSIKQELLNNLNNLLKESKKAPVVSLYDLYDGEYRLCNQGHEIIILGEHNAKVIEYMISVFEKALVVSGLFNEIDGVGLQANYVTVKQNAELCNASLANGNVKANKVEKIKGAISKMVEVGKAVVFFETYRKSLLEIGVKEKEINSTENVYTKQYMPLKKYLQKELNVSFADICDIVVDENAPWPMVD